MDKPMTEKRKIHNWEELYQQEPAEQMPWFYNKLDPDFANALTKLEIKSGRVLDLGTGPGTQARILAEMGFMVTATDISKSAIEKVKQNIPDINGQIEFVQDDILETQLNKKFHLVLDRGCFHVMHSEQRPIYLTNIYSLIEDHGYLFLKCFSHLETMEEGPYRFTPDEITAFFEQKFKIHSITPSVFHGTRDPLPKALFVIMETR